MARLLGYLANQNDRLLCAVTHERTAIGADLPLRGDGWGIGSYQGHEALLRKRPTDQRDELALPELVRGLRASAALLHVRTATVGARTLENTHPFRHRQWLFAHLGTVTDFAARRAGLVAQVPDLLSRSIAGDTDSEVLFYLFLTEIHAAGALDDLNVSRATVADALRRMIHRADEGVAVAPWSLVVTNGTVLVALSRGIEVSWVRRNGIRDCAVCRKASGARVDHETLRYVLASSTEGDAHAGLSPLAPDAVLAVDRDLDTRVDPL